MSNVSETSDLLVERRSEGLDSDAISKLFGISRPRFLAENFECKPLHKKFDAGATKEYAVPTAEEFSELLALGSAEARSIRLVKDGQPVETPILRTGRLDLQAVWTLFYSGVSITFISVHRVDAKLKRICDEVLHALGLRASVNAYLTPPNAAASSTHIDAHDVIVIQASGSKTWDLFVRPDALAAFPIGHGNVSPAELESTHLGKFQLDCGDTLYVPRGVPHKARANNEASLHFSFGLLPIDFAELVGIAAEVARRHAPEFRRHISPDLFVRPGLPVDIATVRSLCERICDPSTLSKALHTIRKDSLVQEGITVRALVSHDAGSPESRIRWRAGVFAESIKMDERSTVVTNGVKATSFTGREREMYLHIRDAPIVTASDFPSEPVAYKSVVERLSALGLVELVD